MQCKRRQVLVSPVRRIGIADTLFVWLLCACAGDGRHDSTSRPQVSRASGAPDAKTDTEAAPIMPESDGPAAPPPMRNEPARADEPTPAENDAGSSRQQERDASLGTPKLDAGAGDAGASIAPVDASDGRTCSFTFTQGLSGESVTCRLTSDARRTCEAAIRCMCEGGVAPQGPRDTDLQRCVDRWLIPRGGLTLADFCRVGDATPAVSLAKALNDLALAYKGALVASPACEQLPATY